MKLRPHWTAYAVFLAVLSYHFFVLWKTSVDIPFWDEWETLNAHARPSGTLSLKWLTAQHNEHRIVFTRLLTWAHYQLHHWDLRVAILTNFVLYTLILGTIAYWVRKIHPDFKRWILALFMTFLLSPINSENHGWAFQSQFHFTILFFLLSSTQLFHPSQSRSRLLLGSLFAVCELYTFGSGIVFAIVLGVTFSVFKILRAHRNHTHAQKEILSLATVLLILGAGLGSWLYGFHPVDSHPQLALPYQLSFWRFFSNLVSLGFGYLPVNFLIGMICVTWISIPIYLSLKKIYQLNRHGNSLVTADQTQEDAWRWMNLTWVLGVLGALSAITLGRAGFGVQASKTSRYAEIAMMLVPWVLCLWYLELKDQPKLKLKAIWITAIIAFFGFGQHKSFGRYQDARVGRLEGVQCVREFYQGKNDGNCPSLYPMPIADYLRRAQALQMSFTQ